MTAEPFARADGVWLRLQNGEIVGPFDASPSHIPRQVDKINAAVSAREKGLREALEAVVKHTPLQHGPNISKELHVAMLSGKKLLEGL